MFIDTRGIDEGREIETTVCVVGAGVAGITIALELDRCGIDTCLLESGGYRPDEDTRDLYRGENAGLPYAFADGSRSRYFGGSSNCWGGWCRPLDPWDFDKRDWVPGSGWPFGFDELAPYYARTHALLKLGPDNFDPPFWEQAIGRHDVRRIPLVTGDLRDTIAQFSPPARFGKLYRGDLERSPHIRVFLHANVVHIDTDAAAHHVERVQVATLTGRRMSVTAKRFVLAAGGIENARLLLASNRVQAAGLGNAHDNVGRYFMDHPRIMSGSVRFAPGWARNKLYDIKYHYQNAAVAAYGTPISSQFAPTPAVLRREKLLNSRVWFFSVFYGEGSDGAQALIRCKQALLRKEQPGWRLRDDLVTMLRHPIDTAGFGLTRAVQPRALIRDVKLQAIVEAQPNRESRVTLAEQRDRLGMPRVKVAWRLTELAQRTFDRTFELLAQELRTSAVAQVRLDPPLAGRAWPASLEGTWHHMGTTRMHESAREGVVDRDCKVFGIDNLFVAGSSVFPTVGANFPTITIAALALRLAGHLVKSLHTPDAVVVPASLCHGADDNTAVPLVPVAVPFASALMRLVRH
ncbi:FAD-dependent oxidoreductase [Trinickia diaoshuihuensis]|uniref:FAD-dependent oxidoreductase n=1 Tax=Trinickia diaoshuihuensis TaxID=2292265 RepID=UPI000E237117|nr:GMC family oxidoreductase [Trinickia diaoshuihuensis]